MRLSASPLFMPCENKTRAKLGQDANLVVYKLNFCNVVNICSDKIECSMSSGKPFPGSERRQLCIERGLTRVPIAAAADFSTLCMGVLKNGQLECSPRLFATRLPSRVNVHLPRNNHRRSKSRLENWNSSTPVDTGLNC